jgi:hypothetical protein
VLQGVEQEGLQYSEKVLEARVSIHKGVHHARKLCGMEKVRRLAPLHHWHGRFADRRYRERWAILVDGKYDPMEDVGLTCDGILQLTRPGLRFVGELDDYFVGRKEDHMSV